MLSLGRLLEHAGALEHTGVRLSNSVKSAYVSKSPPILFWGKDDEIKANLKAAFQRDSKSVLGYPPRISVKKFIRACYESKVIDEKLCGESQALSVLHEHGYHNYLVAPVSKGCNRIPTMDWVETLKYASALRFRAIDDYGS